MLLHKKSTLLFGIIDKILHLCNSGTGTGLIVASNFVVVNAYFKERRAWAVGLQMTGGSMSQMIMPQVIAVLLQYNGFVGSVLFVAAYVLNSGVAALLYDPLCKHSKPLPDSTEEMQPLSRKRNIERMDESTNIENRGTPQILEQFNITIDQKVDISYL